MAHLLRDGHALREALIPAWHQLYTRHLMQAVNTLEAVIKANPTAVNYAAVFNLCTLYDLQVCRSRSWT